MSKGPGRIERAIDAILDAEPESAFTVEKLCERVYPDTNGVEKKHRVAVIRAAKNLLVRRPEVVWQRGEGLGKTLSLCRRDNFASYAIGKVKCECRQYRTNDPRYTFGRKRTVARDEADEAEVRETGAALMRDRSDPRYLWYREVQMFLAKRDGDTDKLAQLKAEEERVIAALQL